MKVLHFPTSYGKEDKPKPTFRCCLCGKLFTGFGNNPAPLTYDEQAQCCNECNWKYVIPERMKRATY